MAGWDEDGWVEVYKVFKFYSGGLDLLGWCGRVWWVRFEKVGFRKVGLARMGLVRIDLVRLGLVRLGEVSKENGFIKTLSEVSE